MLASIKSGGEVSMMLFSIGGGGSFGEPPHRVSDTDFHNIQTRRSESFLFNNDGFIRHQINHTGR